MTSPPSDELALSRQTRSVSLAALRLHHALADRMQLAPVELATVTCVIDHGPLTPKQLGAMLMLGTSSMTVLLDRLEQGGWVRRQPNPADGRSVLIEATEKTHRESRARLDAMIGEIGRMVARRAPEERAVVSAFLAELVQAMDGALSDDADG